MASGDTGSQSSCDNVTNPSADDDNTFFYCEPPSSLNELFINDEEIFNDVKYPEYNINGNIVTVGADNDDETARKKYKDCINAFLGPGESPSAARKAKCATVTGVKEGVKKSTCMSEAGCDDPKIYTFNDNGNLVSVNPVHSHGETSVGGMFEFDFSDIETFIECQFKGVYCFFADFVKGVKKLATDLIDSILDGIKNMVNSVYCKIRGTVMSWYTKVKTKVMTAYCFITSVLNMVRDNLQNFIKAATAFVKKQMKRGTDLARSAYRNAVKYSKYALYAIIALTIVVLILAIVFRFVPIDLRIEYKTPAVT